MKVCTGSDSLIVNACMLELSCVDREKREIKHMAWQFEVCVASPSCATQACNTPQKCLHTPSKRVKADAKHQVCPIGSRCTEAAAWKLQQLGVSGLSKYRCQLFCLLNFDCRSASHSCSQPSFMEMAAWATASQDPDRSQMLSMRE